MIEQRAEAKQTSNVIHTHNDRPLYDASDSSSVEDVYGLGGERQTAPLEEHRRTDRLERIQVCNMQTGWWRKCECSTAVHVVHLPSAPLATCV